MFRKYLCLLKFEGFSLFISKTFSGLIRLKSELENGWERRERERIRVYTRKGKKGDILGILHLLSNKKGNKTNQRKIKVYILKADKENKER